MSFRFASLLLTTTALSGLPAMAQQLPTGGSVAAGSVSIASPRAGQMNVTQSSSSAIVNWQTFSVGQGGRVDISQPTSGSTLLNRVTSAATSVIAGQVNANGQVYLINPNGIAITSTGNVTASGFVGSSLDIANEAFMAGSRTFRGTGQSGEVTNAGQITASEGGFAALIGGRVENSGTIKVPAGRVGLGAAEQVTLDFTGDGFLQVALPSQGGDSTRPLVQQSGRIQARDGVVELRAATARDAVREAVNMSGVIVARGIRQDKGGTVVLDGGEGGTTRVSGRIVTSAKPGKTATANAKTGGRIDVIGRNIALTGATLDASGAAGGGTIHVGGGKGGSGPLPQAERVSADKGTILKADAIQSGNGGTIIVWSNSATAFAGRLSATGGQTSGDGGFAEVSSKGLLSFTGKMDLTATGGTPGTLLLDPYDVVISNDTGSDLQNGAFAATTTSVINVATLQAALANGSVAISTGASDSSGTGGTITISSDIIWSGRSTNLTLTAAKGIVIGAIVTDNALGTLTLNTGEGYGLTFTNGGRIDLPQNFVPTGLPASHLTINGTAYTLVNSMDGLAALQGSSGSFALTSDLNSSKAYTSSVINTFQGRLEGLGHKISNLNIAGTSSTLGLIGTATGAAISNLTLDGGSITNSIIGASDNSGTGALVGYGTNVLISSVTSTVKVAGGDTPTGGLVGSLIGNDGLALISNSHVTGDVTAANYTGGLVGWLENASVQDSTSSGSVSYDGRGFGIGGLVGFSYNSKIKSSSAFGSVTSADSDSVGGLVGYAVGSTISFSTANGDVAGLSDVGGLVGIASLSNIDNSSSRGNVTLAFGGSFGGGGLVGYLELSSLSQSSSFGSVQGYNGLWFGGAVGIANLSSVVETSSAGNVTAPGASSVGGLVGGSFETLISRSHASGNVSGNNTVGGLVGYFADIDTQNHISGSSAVGTVTGLYLVGGLVGVLDTAIISQSFSTGRVIQSSGGLYFGGLVGEAFSSTITQSYSTGAVLAPDSSVVGALIGASRDMKIREVYASGAVRGKNSVGAIVGNQEGYLDAAATYWDVASTGIATSAIGSPLKRGALPADFDPSTWGIVADISNPYFLSSFSGKPIAITGSLKTISGAASADIEGITLMATDGTSSYQSNGSSGADGQYVILADPFVLQNGWAVALSGTSGSVRLLHNVATVNREVNLVTGAFTYGSAATNSDDLSRGATDAAATLQTQFGRDMALLPRAYFASGDLDVGNIDAPYGLYLQSGGYMSVYGHVATGKGRITMIAGNDLILTEDSTIRGSTPLLAALDGAFISAAGAQSVSATSGNWLIYAKEANRSGFGSLNSDNYALTNVSFDVAVTTQAGGNQYAFGGKVPLIATPTGSKTYGDIASFDAASNITFENPNADAYRVKVTANIAFTMTSDGSVATAGVGRYDLRLDLSATSSTEVEFLTNTGSLTVRPREITVSADSSSRAYGDANPDLTWKVTSGNLVNNDTLAVTLTTLAGVTSNTGSYPIYLDVSGQPSKNYFIAINPGSLKVTPRPITIAAKNAERFYGDTNPDLAWALISGSLVNGDSIIGALSTSASATSDKGAYIISTTGLSASSNYAFTRNDAVLTVNARPIAIAAKNAERFYGDANPDLAWALTSGNLVNGDSIIGALSTSASATSDKSTYIISAAGLSASSNYAVTRNDAVLTVNARPITVAANRTERLYGEINPDFTWKITSGSLVNGDSISGALTTSAGVTSKVGDYLISAAGLSASTNYTLTTVGSTLSVKARPITITADSLSRTYGDANPSLTWQVTNGVLVNGDRISGALSTAAGLASTVGDYTISSAGLSASTNYKLTAVGGTLSVKARPIMIAAQDVSKLQGATDPTLTYRLLSGTSLANGDSFGLVRADGEAVGTYAIRMGNFAKANNYSVTFAPGTLTILQWLDATSSSLIARSSGSTEGRLLPPVSTISTTPAVMSLGTSAIQTFETVGQDGEAGQSLTDGADDRLLVIQNSPRAADGLCLHNNLCVSSAQ